MIENNPQTANAKSVRKIKDIPIVAWFLELLVLLEDKSSSLFILKEDNILRKVVRAVVNSTIFEYIILAAILVNCIVMAMEEHLPGEDRTELRKELDKTELYFLVIFSTETFLKIIAQGFVLHPGSYMRNVWNIMDFFVVVTGIMSAMQTPTDGKQNKKNNFKILKSIRVLRPLKLISGVPSLQVVMSSILKAMAPLLQIGLLILFAIVIFAIIGLEFYAGVLHKTCYYIEDHEKIAEEGGKAVPCSSDIRSTENTTEFVCADMSADLEKNSTCLPTWEGPNDGITNFDNIMFAMLTVFQCITMEGWTPIMYWMNDAVGSGWNWLYFVPLIVIGSFFMLNLVLGVLSGEFAKEREKVESRQAFLKLRRTQQVERELGHYINWICKAEELILAEERTSDETRKHIVEVRRRAERKKLKKMGKMGKSTDTEDDEEENDEDRANRKCKGFWLAEKRLRYWIRNAVKTQFFYWFIITLVFLNTVCEAVEHYGQPEWLTVFSNYAEYIFLSLFVTEMFVKMYAVGVRKHFESAFNRFDCIVISGSIFEIIWSYLKDDTFGLSVLRALRLLRIFKITSYWSSLRNLVISLLNSMKSIMSLLLLLFLFIFIFGLLGMQFFGGKFYFDGERPDAHFDTFSPALLTVFQVLTGEDWNEVMYSGIKAHGGVDGGGMIYSLYFIILTLFGNYTLLNVFLAIAVDNLASAQELTAAEEEQKEEDKEKQWQELQKEIENLKTGDQARIADLTRQQEEFKHIEKEHVEEEEDETGPKEMLPYSSMFCFSTTNPIRRGVHWIVNVKYFDYFIMFVIVLSSISLAAEDPVWEKNPRNLLLNKIDIAFTVVFATEMVLKVIDLGVILHPKSYLRDIWNIMDSVVVICALVSMALDGIGSGQEKSDMSQKLQTMKSLRVLRVLRPLKTIKRIPKLKAVFDCVVNSLKNVVNILVVYMLFNFIFAVIGVKLYNGKFHYCTDPSKKIEQDCHGKYFEFDGTRNLPEVKDRIWKVKSFNYDSVMYAMLTLYAVQSTEGWPVVLKDSMDSYQKDKAAVPNYRIEMSIYYIVYFIIFPFFFVNIFVALIIVTFQEQGEAELQLGGIDKNQKSCIDFAINARPSERYIPEDQQTFQYKVWSFVTSPAVDNFVLLLIVLNTVTLMMKTHDQDEKFETVMRYVNMVFTVLFTIESVLKIIGFGFKKFFKDPWNVFDLVTVAGSLIELLYEQVISPLLSTPSTDIKTTEFNVNPYADRLYDNKNKSKSSSVGFLRLFRAARLVKLMRRGATIRVLLWTFVQSFKALPYVCLLIAMLFFIYAIVGMQMFGNIKINPETQITRHNNFRTFGNALLLLFRCATGEAWPNIMMDCREWSYCDDISKKNGQECGSPLSTVYFVSFIFFCSFLMLNLFVAVIMDNFDYLTRDKCILGAHHLDEFIRVWTEYDPSASGKISYIKMYEALRIMSPPLGFGIQCPSRLAYGRLIRMNMPVDEDGNVDFTTTLFALIRENLKIHVPIEEKRTIKDMDEGDEEMRRTIIHMWPLNGPKMVDLLVPPPEKLSGKQMTVGKIYGGLMILQSWRSTRFGKINKGLQCDNRTILKCVLKFTTPRSSPDDVDQTSGARDSNDETEKGPMKLKLNELVRRISLRTMILRTQKIFNMQKAHNDQEQPNEHHLHPNHDRRTSVRPSDSRSPSPALLDAASNVIDFIRDERLHRNRRGFANSRYSKPSSSASTSPEPSPHRSANQGGKQIYARRPARQWGKGPCHNMTDQLKMESYDYDNNVLSGRSRTPSPGKIFENRFSHWSNISSSKQTNGRKLPQTPKQPSTLQIPIKLNINFPRLDSSPSNLLTDQSALQPLPNRFNNRYNSTQYDDIERELYEQERDVDSEFDYKTNEEPGTIRGPLSFEEALLLSRPVRSTSVVWNGFKTSVVGYSPEDSKLDDDEWC